MKDETYGMKAILNSIRHQNKRMELEITTNTNKTHAISIHFMETGSCIFLNSLEYHDWKTTSKR